MAGSKRAAPVAPGRPQIKELGTETYAPERDENQASDFEEFIREIEAMATWFESLNRRLDQRHDYLEKMNGFAGYDDLAMEIRDFNRAARGLIAKYAAKRRAAA